MVRERRGRTTINDRREGKGKGKQQVEYITMAMEIVHGACKKTNKNICLLQGQDNIPCHLQGLR
jgi:hypothetical protein